MFAILKLAFYSNFSLFNRFFLPALLLGKESTIFIAFRQCLLVDTPEVTKIVLPKVLRIFKKSPNCTCWPKELNQKSFPRNIQYRTVPLSFFRHCETFFGKKIPKGSHLHILELCDRMAVEKSKRFPSFSFFGIVRLFSKTFFCRREYFDTLKSFCYF